MNLKDEPDHAGSTTSRTVKAIRGAMIGGTAAAALTLAALALFTSSTPDGTDGLGMGLAIIMGQAALVGSIVGAIIGARVGRRRLEDGATQEAKEERFEFPF